MKSPKFEILSIKQYLNSNVKMTKTFGFWNLCNLNLFRISHYGVFFCVLCCLFCLLAVTGCNKPDQKAPLLKQIEQLTEQNTEITGHLEKTESENKQLKEQVQVLSGLPEEVKGENLYNLRQIKLGRYTDFFDKDHDGRKETLIVYIQPIDEQGDKIKASGAVDVQLWDLNQSDGQAMLGQWKVEPDELKTLWYATLITINYRLTFDIAEIIENFDKPLTVKVKFTDYLSGRVFEDQKVIRSP